WEARQYASGALGMLGDEREEARLDKRGAEEPKLTATDCKQYGCSLPVQEVAANRLKTLQAFQAPLKAGAQCKSDAACWMAKLNDPEGTVRQRAALGLGRVGRADAV